MTKIELKDFMKNTNVLFVDDEEFVVETMKEIFPLLFKKSYYATNGVDGIQICQEHDIDLVITDLSMPKMNGMDMIKHIKEFKPDMKIICVSGHNEQEYTQIAQEYGSTFIIKPISTSELYRAIEQII